jgi:CelD/BcsL family acetyltransferase involved in cellulose biosynthesis
MNLAWKNMRRAGTRGVETPPAGKNGIVVTLSRLPPAPELEVMWRELESRAAGSFFTSWTWISAWLGTYVADTRRPSAYGLITAWCGGKIVALGILGRASSLRNLMSGTKILLHQTGRTDDAAAFIEYNGFLIDRGATPETMPALLNFLNRGAAFRNGKWAWSTFHVAGAAQPLMDAIRVSAISHRILRQWSCPWVNLSKIEPGREGYLSGLSRNTRGQIRRASRIVEEYGALKVTSAKTTAEAKEFFAALRVFHEETWRRREGTRGAFAHPLFARFIHAVIDAGQPRGAVDLLKISAGPTTVGVLLNFIHGGHVYAYQSGLAYSADNRVKPGLVSHALAIAHYRAQGCLGYHFMAGDARYKTSLGNDVENLSWVELRRRDPWLFLARTFHSRKHALARVIGSNV